MIRTKDKSCFPFLYFSFVCLGSGVSSRELFTPCKITDIPCIEKSINGAVLSIFDGIPELGIESTDPQFNAFIEVDGPSLNIKFFNSTISGYKTCTLTNLRIISNLEKVAFDWNCPQLIAKGQYDMKGHIGTLALEGNGDFQLVAGSFLVNLECDIEKVKRDDGKTIVAIKDFTFVAKPLSPITYDFKNLFNKREDLAEAVHKFARENWNAIAELVQDPIWNASLKGIFMNINKYLETSPVEDTLIES